MMKRVIFLVRHAEPVRQDEIKRYLGQSDPCLSALGMRQAEQLACTLKNYSIRSIYSSDLLRAEQTALKIGERHTCQLEKIRELREVDLGEWEGKCFSEIKSLYPEEFDSRGRDIGNHRPPGGESFRDLAGRVIPVFEKIVRHPEGNIVIVAHAGVNRVILCHLLQLPLNNLFTIKQNYARVNTIHKNTDCYSVQGINERLSL